MVYLVLELVGPWVVLGFSVDMEAFDELLSINVPWSQEFSGVLRIWTEGSEVKASACNVGYLGSIPGPGRSSGEGNGNSLQYSCLGNPMARTAWQAIVPGVAKELDIT